MVNSMTVSQFRKPSTKHFSVWPMTITQLGQLAVCCPCVQRLHCQLRWTFCNEPQHLGTCALNLRERETGLAKQQGQRARPDRPEVNVSCCRVERTSWGSNPMDSASLTTADDITGSSCCTSERGQTGNFEHPVNRNITSFFPPPPYPLTPFSPSLIRLMASVDVKHHVYLELIFNTQSTMTVTPKWVSDRRQVDNWFLTPSQP